MNLKTLTFIIFLFGAFSASAQKDSLVYYLDQAGRTTTDKGNADIKVVILPPNATVNKNISIIRGYSLDGKLKFVTGSLTTDLPLNLQGDFIEYYPNGNKKRLRHFNKGEEAGPFTLWYENGNLQTDMQANGNERMREKDYYENGQLKLDKIPKGFYNDETEYFPDGKLSRKLTTNYGGRGVETIYYRNGGIKTVTDFLDQRQEQKIVAYYPNGKPYFTKETSPGDDGPVAKYIECSDSTGKLLTVKGNGDWVEYSDDFTYRASQGKVVKGLPDSVWNIAYAAAEGDYQTFKNGKLIGHNRYGVTEPVLADSYDTPPEFPGGLDEFYHFLAKNLRYPAAAREKKITGRVIISFIVEKDGSISNVEVIRDIGGGCGTEAARVIALSPKWTPGTKAGVAVSVKYSVPVSFTLSNEIYYVH